MGCTSYLVLGLLQLKPKESKLIRVRQYRHINMDVIGFFFFFDGEKIKIKNSYEIFSNEDCVMQPFTKV